MSLNLSFISKFAVSRILAQIFAVVATLASARWLGPVAQGEVATTLSWATIVASLAGLSIGQTIHYLVRSDQKNSSNSLIGTLLTVAIAHGFLGGFAGLSIYSLLSLDSAITVPMFCAAIALCPLIIWEDYLVNITSKLGRLRELAQFQLAGRLFTLLSMAILIKGLKLGSQGSIASFVIGGLAVLIYSTRRLVTDHTNFQPSLASSLAISAKWLHLNTISSLALGQANILILAHYGDETDVACYSIANQIIGVLLWLPQAIVTISYAGIAECSPDEYWPTHRRLICIGLFITACFVILSWLLVPQLLTYIAGPSYFKAGIYFRNLLPCVVGLAFAVLMTPQWISRGLFRLTASLTFAVGLTSLVASIIQAKIYGVQGIIMVNLAVYSGIVPLSQLTFAIWCEIRSRESNRTT